MTTEAAVCLFPRASGGYLNIQDTLSGTLAIEMSLVRRRCSDKPALKLFIGATEQAWEIAKERAMDGEINFILWLREVVRESYEMGLWVPPAYVRRLRQLERRDLVMQNSQGNILLPLYAGLPQSFVDVCEFMAWNFPTIVPTWDRKYEDVRERDASVPSKEVTTAFVVAVCEAYETLPKDLEADEMRAWIVKHLEELGHTVK